MSDNNAGTQYAASRALDMAEDNGEGLADMKKKLSSVAEEVRFLAAFNERLLGLLKSRMKLDDSDLEFLIRRAEAAEARREEKPGIRVAPLCHFCFRPMQDDSVACIYCGRAPD
jgi:hypothetical protein